MRIVLILVVLSILFGPDARAQSAHVGKWTSKEINLIRLGKSCAYVEVTQSIYELLAGMNRSVYGNFNRLSQQSIWSGDLNCRLPGSDPNGKMRLDGWAVSGTPASPNLQNLDFSYMGCKGSCENELRLPQKTKTKIFADGSSLKGEVIFRVTNSTEFRRDLSVEQDEAEASKAFWPLYQPLAQGNCNHYLTHSLDAEAKGAVDAKNVCTFSYELVKLLPHVIGTEPSQAHSAAKGNIQGLFLGPLTLRTGDVLVARFLVVTETSMRVLAGAVMRKQADGAWKILDIVPI